MLQADSLYMYTKSLFRLGFPTRKALLAFCPISTTSLLT
jgi:hypothetical protein